MSRCTPHSTMAMAPPVEDASSQYTVEITLPADLCFCKYSSSGCVTTLKVTDGQKEAHEAVCDFRYAKCPHPNYWCKWVGPLEQILPHIIADHSIQSYSYENLLFIAKDIGIPDTLDWVVIQRCHGQSFIVTVTKDIEREAYFGSVVLVGSDKKATEFIFKIKVTGVGKIVEKVSGIHEENKSVHLVDEDTVLKLSTKKKCLEMLITICPIAASFNSEERMFHSIS